jgi:SAM-dependent methyltransferase
MIFMSELKQKVEKAAGSYEKLYVNFDYQLANYGFQTLKPFFRGKLGLELGPASGFMTKFLVNEFETLHIVEGSLELLNQIPYYPNVTKHHSYFEDYQTSLKYDTIIMSHVLEHISNPALVLGKIYNWLASDGVFIVAVPNAKSIHRLVAVQMGLLNNEYELNERDHHFGHYRVYDQEILKDQISSAGFKIVDTGGYFLKPLTNNQIENNWTQEMIEGFYRAGKYFQDHCAEIFVVCKI